MKKTNNKGFTLIELLIVIFLVSVLTVTAVSSYIKSTDTFEFLNSYKNVVSSIKAARSYAITNKENNGQVPKRYGVRIQGKVVTVFADTGDTDFVYEAPCTDCDPQPGDPKPDTIITTKQYDFSQTSYFLTAFDSKDVNLQLPIVLFYESDNATLTIKTNAGDGGANETLAKNEHKFAYLIFNDPESTQKKYLVVFQISGLPEEYEKAEVDAM